ncbi:MAG TPA: ABC transporter substrate-binding protein [Vicinamibacterales bacterium]|jgi:ABC-type branched-subunit amino acid transport system substrate-binding protein|nr:ABC transporter substrate-binding protein [Vicinamibacterales bacterium]
MRGDRSASDAKWLPVRAFTLPLLMLLVSAGHSQGAMQSDPRDGLTAQERRGRDIYFGLATTAKASIGTPPVEAPAMMLACANCHNSDGRGKPEGGVVPSDITWESLTKPYGVTHPSGRTHPPYTERLLVRAICLGIDPAGNTLHPAMPRFQMSRADIDAVTQYLKRLSTDSPSGISDTEIRLGTVLPATGPLERAGRAVKAVLTAYFDALNAQGGIYGRRLELRVAWVDAIGPDPKTSVDAFLRDATPFAMVGGLLWGTDRGAIALTEARGVPFVGPLTIFPEPSAAGRTTFYLLSGVEQQARALLEYRRTRADPVSLDKSDASVGSVAIVHSPQAVPADVVDRIRDYATRSGWHVTMVNLDRAGLGESSVADELKRSMATHALLLIGGGSLMKIATGIVAVNGNVALLVPGSLATNDLLHLPQPLIDRTFIALPSLPSDQTQTALDEYRKLSEAYHLPSTEMAWQLAGLGSAKVLTHALTLAGRGLTRSSLVAALEDLSDFDTGLMPHIRFGRGRRLGSAGAYIVTFDPVRKEFRQVTGWLAVN